MTYKEIISKISKELNIPERIVDKTYKAYWKYIRAYIQSLPLKDIVNEEEYLELRTNFNIPSLGKLTCNYKKSHNINLKYKKDAEN